MTNTNLHWHHTDIDDAPTPTVVDRATFQTELDALRIREKENMRERDAISAARRRMPMVEVDATTPLTGAHGQVSLLEVFEGRRQLIAYYFMWGPGSPAPEQCEGCTLYTTQIGDLAYLHARDVTYATVCQGPYEESMRYREFMGWTMPWYSASHETLENLFVGRQVGMFHLICYLRDGDRVFETYWTNGRGVEVMGNTYTMLDLTPYGRQETWEDSPAGWPKRWGPGTTEINPYRIDGRPIAQWPRLDAGRSDDLEAAEA